MSDTAAPGGGAGPNVAALVDAIDARARQAGTEGATTIVRGMVGSISELLSAIQDRLDHVEELLVSGGSNGGGADAVAESVQSGLAAFNARLGRLEEAFVQAVDDSGSGTQAVVDDVRAAVEGALAAAPAATPKAALNEFYVRARMQRFGGRNVTTTGLFARQGLPFLDNEVVAAAFALRPDRQRDGRAMREALMAWAPRLARVPLETGIRVQPRSWRAPATHARWGLYMGRRALVRYGGAKARRLAPRPTIDWKRIAASPALRALVDDLLPPTGARVHDLLEPAGVRDLRNRALAGGGLYPLGLVLTLELSLRRIATRA